MRGEQTVVGHRGATLLVFSLICGLADKHDKVEGGHWPEDKKDCADICEGQVEVAVGTGTRTGFRVRGYGGRGA